MPEGDTIYRTAARLRTAITGQRIVAARRRHETFAVDSLPNHVVASVEARGKHLLMHLDDGRTIHSHLGMTGSWHLYELHQPWQKPQHYAALVLDFSQLRAVCFSPKTLELLTADGLRRHGHLNRLGPDLLAGGLNWEDVVIRFRRHPAIPIGEAIMDQTIVCGIGNVYKSEMLFLEKLNPFTPIAQLPDVQLSALIKRGARLMARNLEGYPRRTRFGRDGPPLWVYGRRGKPCLACGTVIQLRRQGELGRSTYWCPSCQATGTNPSGKRSGMRKTTNGRS